MSIPVYLFLFTYLPMLAYGLFILLKGGTASLVATAPLPSHPITIFLYPSYFRNRFVPCSTGIEVISNGVPAFEKPESDNAGENADRDGDPDGNPFCGKHRPDEHLGIVASSQETILRRAARRLLGNGVGYFVI